MNILGLGGLFTSDASCALLRDGLIVAAIEQKKLVRNLSMTALPYEAIREVLRLGGIGLEQIDCVAIARPFTTGTAVHIELRESFPAAQVVVVEHHLAHAASAYFASPFHEATVLTIDRRGDFRCTARWQATGNVLRLEKESYLPDSLGELYSRVTELLGYQPNADEHKVQWMSASGDARFVTLFEEMMGPAWPQTDRTYFDASRVGSGSFSARFYERLHLRDGAPIPEALKPHVAHGLQRALENTVARMALSAASNNVCLAGGVAFNAMLVARLERDHNVFVQPVAGNAGNAMGAAYYAWHGVFEHPKTGPLETLALGPEFGPPEIKQVLENCKLSFQRLLTNDELIETAVGLLSENRIVAWMQGRMEFGSRALGYRSILASPLDAYSAENLNVYIKHREPFRKFAASVPAELADQYFDTGANARFLATVGRVKAGHRETFRNAVLGGEDLIRVHLVREEENPLYHRLLHAAGKRTGLPVLYNTSFNLFGDPLVCTPRDAVRSFYSSGIDAMLVGTFLLAK